MCLIKIKIGNLNEFSALKKKTRKSGKLIKIGCKSKNMMKYLKGI